MEVQERERRKLKLWVRILLIIIILIGVILPIIGIYKNITTIKNEGKTKIYSANINKNTNYKVDLYDNNFTNETEMDSNKVYIADLVKDIKFNLYYTYSGTDKTNLNYTYDIKAKLYGKNINNATGESNLVWEKDYTLLEKQTKTANETSGFNITENLNIDYPKYKEEVNNFKRQFGMNLSTKLKITMNIKYNVNYKNKNIDKNDKIVLEIPLGVQAFSIDEIYNKRNTYNIYEENSKIKTNGPLLTGICTIILIITIIVFILTYKAIFNIKPKSKYTKELEKILKSYGEIIVEVTTPPKTKGYTLVQVKNFEEMIDLEEELRIPIILYESIYKNVATFTITYNNTIYKYTLKN